MQLLFSSPVPQQQFASLSLLLPPGAMAEPLVCVSPTCTLSKRSATQLISDLHSDIRRKDKEDSENQPAKAASTKNSGLGPVQTYRSASHSNLAMQYAVVRGSDSLPLQTVVQSLHLPEGTTPVQIDPSAGVMGVVLAVAVMGHETLFGTSSSVYALPQRIQDCLGALLLSGSSTPASCPAALRLLHAYLLTSSPEERATNAMVAQTISFPATQELRGGVLSPMMLGAGRHRQQGNHHHDHPAAPFLVWDVTDAEPPCSATAARNLVDQMTVLSVAQDDAALAAYQRSAQERKAQLDVGGRFRRRKADDADLEGMDYKGPVKATTKTASTSNNSIAAPRKLHAPPAAEKLRSSKKDTKVSTRSDTASASSSFDPFRSSNRSAPIAPSRLGSSSEPAAQPQRSSRQLQINFALNEDLACSYKLSQLASCSVEGVVQVQVKSNGDGNAGNKDIDFHLLLRDALGQVDSLTENRKFVAKQGSSSGRDYRFQISIPKTDTYFPLLKYKCLGDLRPVPIRVQTKVKTDGEHCRVALQISSNPNNTAPLSDLTIMLGVPPGIYGESLTSQPTGGVWEPSKSSVLWCVSELNSGEKFQLQARFAMDTTAATVADGSQFPVLVRCQSLQAQLSEVSLEARSAQDAIGTKIARRYRVSHREKNG